MEAYYNNKNGNILGQKIRDIRVSKGISQEELGNYVGKSKSSICKLEKGKVHLSMEEASFLARAMGAKLEVSTEEPNVAVQQRSKLITLATYWFAKRKHMSIADAYKYLLVYKGIDFLDKHFLLEQSLSKEEIVDNLVEVCRRNGGKR